MRIIIDTKQGLMLKLNKEEQVKKFVPTFEGIVNLLLQGLMAVCVQNTVKGDGEEHDKSVAHIYELLTIGFTNCLSTYAPDLYFPTVEEDQKFMEAVAKYAADCPDNSENIKKLKEEYAAKIEQSSFSEGYLDEDGQIRPADNFRVVENTDAES